MSKHILLINQTSALNSPASKEALDMALILAAYEHDVSLLFEDAAVMQLLPQQDARIVDSKNLFKTLKLLDLYEIDQLYVCEDSLHRFALSPSMLAIDCRSVNSSEKAKLCSQQDHLLRF